MPFKLSFHFSGKGVVSIASGDNHALFLASPSPNGNHDVFVYAKAASEEPIGVHVGGIEILCWFYICLSV